MFNFQQLQVEDDFETCDLVLWFFLEFPKRVNRLRGRRHLQFSETVTATNLLQTAGNLAVSLQPFPEFALDVAKSLYLSQRSKTELLVLSDLSSFRNCFGQSQHTQTVKRANRNAKQMHGSRNQARDLWFASGWVGLSRITKAFQCILKEPQNFDLNCAAICSSFLSCRWFARLKPKFTCTF